MTGKASYIYVVGATHKQLLPIYQHVPYICSMKSGVSYPGVHLILCWLHYIY